VPDKPRKIPDPVSRHTARSYRFAQGAGGHLSIPLRRTFARVRPAPGYRKRSHPGPCNPMIWAASILGRLRCITESCDNDALIAGVNHQHFALLRLSASLSWLPQVSAPERGNNSMRGPESSRPAWEIGFPEAFGCSPHSGCGPAHRHRSRAPALRQTRRTVPITFSIMLTSLMGLIFFGFSKLRILD
jgi:hypothetical protein